MAQTWLCLLKYRADRAIVNGLLAAHTNNDFESAESISPLRFILPQYVNTMDISIIHSWCFPTSLELSSYVLLSRSHHAKPVMRRCKISETEFIELIESCMKAEAVAEILSAQMATAEKTRICTLAKLCEARQ